MPIKKDDAGRRWLEVEVEVPGTPEQVWQAIATGPGISSWFVPTDLEERKGGAVTFHLGPGTDSNGHVTAWEPPQRIAYEERGWAGEAPPLATEFIVETAASGSCKVRVVHSLFTSSDEWDDQIESMETGWSAFFRVLRLYLAHFPGMGAATAGGTGHFTGTHDAAWTALLDSLALSDASAGETRDTSRNGGPRLAGTVEHTSQRPHNREVTLLVDTPAPGVALIGTYAWSNRVNIAISLYFYGNDAADVAAREGARWNAWIDERFPRSAAGDAPSQA